MLQKKEKFDRSKQELMIEKPISVREAAEFLNCSPSAIYKLTHFKQIRHFKRGKFCYFKLKDLEAFAFQNEVATQSEINEKAENFLNQQ